MKDVELNRHPLIFLAFLLSVVIFILPVAGDLVFSAWHACGPSFGATVLGVCFAVVLVPLIAGIVLTRKNPQKWRKSKLAVITFVILGGAAFFVVLAFSQHQQKEKTASQAIQTTSQ